MSISSKTIQMALVRLGVKPHLTADERIAGLRNCSGLHNSQVFR